MCLFFLNRVILAHYHWNLLISQAPKLRRKWVYSKWLNHRKKIKNVLKYYFKIKIEMCTSSNKIMEWNNQIINGKQSFQDGIAEDLSRIKQHG